MARDGQTIERGAVQTFRLRCKWAYVRLILDPVSRLWATTALRLWGASVEAGLKVRGRMRLHVEGKLRIGPNVSFHSGPSNFVGGDRRMALWVGRRGTLDIRQGAGLSNTTIFCADSVTIGADTYIGGGCEIYDTDFHQLDADDRIANRGDVPHGPIHIGPKAFVGGWSIVLKNVTIGEGAVVAAGSVVTKPIGPYELWGGVPAKFIRKIEPDEAPARTSRT